jgi:dTDP-4-dehydrorhamnose 3,5-epimerase
MIWKDAMIDGVLARPLKAFRDERGWLAELFRSDESIPAGFPEMGYVSVTHPGVARGPHEHVHQSDRFAFFHGLYRIWLWDARPHSNTRGSRQILTAGAEAPLLLVIPPGVVHAYRNEGTDDAFVMNFPDALYAGRNRTEAVDEIRHEDDPASPFALAD